MINCQHAIKFYIRVSLIVNTKVRDNDKDLERIVQNPECSGKLTDYNECCIIWALGIAHWEAIYLFGHSSNLSLQIEFPMPKCPIASDRAIGRAT